MSVHHPIGYVFKMLVKTFIILTELAITLPTLSRNQMWKTAKPPFSDENQIANHNISSILILWPNADHFFEGKHIEWYYSQKTHFILTLKRLQEQIMVGLWQMALHVTISSGRLGAFNALPIPPFRRHFAIALRNTIWKVAQKHTQLKARTQRPTKHKSALGLSYSGMEEQQQQQN